MMFKTESAAGGGVGKVIKCSRATPPNIMHHGAGKQDRSGVVSKGSGVKEVIPNGQGSGGRGQGSGRDR
ncbi:MAG: hypothetical protein JNK33_05090 [Candidatus Doudnabacteria bacterium]|nr:hypothetical protein [Candidatus Doudnabacteria bacterium]